LRREDVSALEDYKSFPDPFPRTTFTVEETEFLKESEAREKVKRGNSAL